MKRVYGKPISQSPFQNKNYFEYKSNKRQKIYYRKKVDIFLIPSQ